MVGGAGGVAKARARPIANHVAHDSFVGEGHGFHGHRRAHIGSTECERQVLTSRSEISRGGGREGETRLLGYGEAAGFVEQTGVQGVKHRDQIDVAWNRHQHAVVHFIANGVGRFWIDDALGQGDHAHVHVSRGAAGQVIWACAAASALAGRRACRAGSGAGAAVVPRQTRPRGVCGVGQRVAHGQRGGGYGAVGGGVGQGQTAADSKT